MKSQINQLKINSTNIKNTLFKSNKELKKLRAKERNLLNRQKISAKRLQKENFTEGKGSGAGGGMGGYLAGKALAPTMSIIDKLKEFAGTILLGLLINTLPTAIKKVEKFLEENKDIIKTVKDVITATGNALSIIVNIVKGPKAPDLKKLKEDNKELTELSKEFEKGGKFDKEIDGLEKDVTSLNTDLRKEFRDLYTERTPEQVKEDVVETIKQRSTSGSPITRKEFTSKANQYARAKTSKGQRTPLINIPGIGSYQRVPSEGIGGWFGGSKEITKDISGNEIDPKEFDKRYNDIVKSQNEIFESLKSEGVEGYASGGLVNENGPSRLLNTVKQGQSAEEKIAVRKASTFVDLKDSVLKESKILVVKEKSQNEMKNAIKDLREYLEFTKPELTGPSPYRLPSPKHQGPVIQHPPGQSIPALGRIVGYVGSTGLSSGNHIHIETGDGYVPHDDAGKPIPQSVLDNIIVDGRPLHEYNMISGVEMRKHPVTGEMKQHLGYDYPIRGGAPIQLKGGLKYINFHDAGAKGFGKSIMIQDKDGNNYILGHLSKGPDPAPPAGGPSGGNGRISAIKKPGYGKGGSAMAMDLTQTFDDGGSEVVMIMTQQPIVVPGPTRYITRTVTQTMPVPVAIHPKSSGLRSLV